MARAQLKTFDLGYGGLLQGIERGQDRADRKREREEDRIFTAEQNELNRQAQISQIEAKGEQTRQNIGLQGEIDINKIKTRGDLEALRQKERLEFTGGENAKDRLQKGELFDKEWANREKEWMAKKII